MNEKIENALNLALETDDSDLEKSDTLQAGYDSENDTWKIILRHNGNIDFVERYEDITVTFLSNNYAVMQVPKSQIDNIAAEPSVIFIEKPKPFYFTVVNGRREACIDSTQGELGVYGDGVIIAIIDSGIDYANNVFIDADGNTRILELWDQTVNTGTPPEGYSIGSVYTSEQINEAIRANNSQERYSIVPSRDISGHGTHVAGIAAGNFAENKNNNIGIATKSKLIVVKLATPTEQSFPSTIELMEGIDFAVKRAKFYNMPLVVNLSFGNTYGSHDGTSLIETFINSLADEELINIVIGSGNEGNTGGHTSGTVSQNETVNIELAVSNYEKSFDLQLWKSFADTFEIQIIAPDGSSTGILSELNEATKYRFYGIDTELLVYFGTPKPYSPYQELYVTFMPVDSYVTAGIWTIQITAIESVTGKYDLWLPTEAALGTNTRFLRPTPETTLTIPSTAAKAITVGAYDSANERYADFSGRGYTRETDQVKPDIVAPGVNIQSAAVGGGLSVLSGTSMAAPFVSGSVALMMEWGIVDGNDPYLYGEKVKAYLIRGARRLSGFNTWPNPQMGWGALCLRDSIPR